MPRLAPFASLFAAVATLNVGMFVRLRADIARATPDCGPSAGVRDGLALTDERLARVEAALSDPVAQASASAKSWTVSCGPCRAGL